MSSGAIPVNNARRAYMGETLMRNRIAAWMVLGLVLAGRAAGAAPAGNAPAVVSHIQVLSDKIEDVSSLEAWRQAFIKPGMTERQKAIAIWTSVVKFRHQEAAPLEYLDHEDQVYDPIKAFNVYGYGICSGTSACLEALARYAGLEARGWAITGHSVPEIKIDGHWSMLDASLINYFQKADGGIAGVAEIAQDVADWYAAHPDFRGNKGKLAGFMRHGGWKKGPAALAGAMGYDQNGWQAAATHGWNDSMVEYGSAQKNFLYDYSSAVGYEVNVQLRRGEVLTRNWSNKGLQINAPGGAVPGVLTCSTGAADEQLRYAAQWGDLAPGRIGNGTLEYRVPLDDPEFLGAALGATNVGSGAGSPKLHLVDATGSGTLVLRMPSSYVYLTGHITLQAVIGNAGRIAVGFSDNNGLDWKEIAAITAAGEQHLDLTPLVRRRYDYRLKFTLHGKGTGLDALVIRHDIQHSQRPLPALALGANTITFGAGAQEGTITAQAATDPRNKDKNLYLTDLHPQIDGPLGLTPFPRPRADGGSITFPIQTPGDMMRLRVGAAYRARDTRDMWLVAASFDEGKTYVPLGKLEGPCQGMGRYFIFDKVPPGIRAARVRFTGIERNTCVLFDERIAADYAEPHGGFAPVKVTYVWDENGTARQDVHMARQPHETYMINCAAKPLMKSIAVELAP